MNKKKIILISSLAVLVVGFLTHWLVNRVYVPEGHSLLLRYKGPLLFGERKMAKPGYYAAEGEVGILENMRGPGRHFYCPIWWERTVVPDVVISPGQVGRVTCKVGESLPEGEFLVDGEIGNTTHKGILRKVLGPGRHRVNPYGYNVDVIGTQTIVQGGTKKVSGWVQVPTGFVGVVTNATNNPHTKQLKGIQDKVLQPGLYPINPDEQKVDIVGIGFQETSINIRGLKSVNDFVKAEARGEKGEDLIDGGINFPSSDGFPIVLDFTAVWGLMPDQAPNAIRRFGNLELVEQKVVLPQIESICRNNGSEYPAVKLLVGKEREEFQNNTIEEFKQVLKTKDISFMYGLVRHIIIPKEVRIPIQTAFISDELKLTREQEQLTAKKEAELREAEKKVILETSRVNAETSKLVAEKEALGQKTVGETKAETEKLKAAIEKDTAELESQAILVQGAADSEGKKAIEQAKSNKFNLAVKAFGTAQAYNDWVFAMGLPANIELKLFYAGKGTMWTDLKEALRIVTTPDEEKK